MICLLNWVGIPVVFLYLLGMFVYPWLDSSGDWPHVQDVWDRWQALNTGMLAFVSSLVAFNISRYNAEKQRQRDFLAARAFLPAAFSELIKYFKESGLTMIAAWSYKEGEPEKSCPNLPEDYKEVFSQCIKHAETEVGNTLAYILARLQVHDARLRDLSVKMDGKKRYHPDRINLIAYMYKLGELQALVNKIFDYARGEAEFDASPLEWEDFRNAYLNLKIQVTGMRANAELNLEEFTKRALAREANGDMP